MKKCRDAYGQEVLAYHEGKESYEIVERDDGYIALSSGSPEYFAPFKRWPACQKKAVVFVKGRVLDVGAGAGRVSLYIQRRHDVTAIDNSPLAIKVCKARGVKKAMVRPIEDIGKFRQDSFDTIVMFGNNFGLFGSYRKAKRLLRTMRRITSDDALIIAESNDPYKTANPIHLAYQARNRRRGRMSGQLRLRIRYEMCTGDWFDYLIVSRKEMKDILAGTGWKVRRFIDSGKSMYTAIIEKTKSF